MTVTARTPGTRSSSDWPKVSAWTRACVFGAMIGVTAAAAAALIDSRLGGDTLREQAIGLAVVVTAALVGGLALARFQAQVLIDVLERRRHLWIVVTVPVAAVGWVVATAPSGFAQDGSPPSTLSPWLLLVLALVLGACLGALLGAVQAHVLRPAVSHPWRWVGISAVAWSPAVAVVALGATLPPESWPDLAVVLVAPLLGAVAGFVVGRVSGSLLPALSGAQSHDLAVLALLDTPAHVFLGRRLLGLSFTGSVTGRSVRLPLMYAMLGERVVVVPRQSEGKHWWRNIEGRLTDVLVLLRGRWRSGVAEVLLPGMPTYDAARGAYRERCPSAELSADQPVVLISGLGVTPGRH